MPPATVRSATVLPSTQAAPAAMRGSTGTAGCSPAQDAKAYPSSRAAPIPTPQGAGRADGRAPGDAWGRLPHLVRATPVGDMPPPLGRHPVRPTPDPISRGATGVRAWRPTRRLRADDRPCRPPAAACLAQGGTAAQGRRRRARPAALAGTRSGAAAGQRLSGATDRPAWAAPLAVVYSSTSPEAMSGVSGST